MGYESRLYVVEESDFMIPSDNGKKWAEVIGVIELCVCYEIKDVFKEDAIGYIYSDDGNTRIEIDCYGEPLKVASLKSVIIKLKKIVRETDYRRAKIALAFLESVYEMDINERSNYDSISLWFYVDGCFTL